MQRHDRRNGVRLLQDAIDRGIPGLMYLRERLSRAGQMIESALLFGLTKGLVDQEVQKIHHRPHRSLAMTLA